MKWNEVADRWYVQAVLMTARIERVKRGSYTWTVHHGVHTIANGYASRLAVAKREAELEMDRLARATCAALDLNVE